MLDDCFSYMACVSRCLESLSVCKACFFVKKTCTCSVFCLATTSLDTIEQVLASLKCYLGMRLHAPLKKLCVNKKHCYEKQLLPVDSGGSLLQTDMLLPSARMRSEGTVVGLSVSLSVCPGYISLVECSFVPQTTQLT